MRARARKRESKDTASVVTLPGDAIVCTYVGKVIWEM